MNRSGYLDLVYNASAAYVNGDFAVVNGEITVVMPPHATGSIATKGVRICAASTVKKNTSFFNPYIAKVNDSYNVDFATAPLANPINGDVISVEIVVPNPATDTDRTYTVSYRVNDLGTPTWNQVALGLALNINSQVGLSATPVVLGGTVLTITGGVFKATLKSQYGLALTHGVTGTLERGGLTDIEQYSINDPRNNKTFGGTKYDVISVDCGDVGFADTYVAATQYKKVRFFVENAAATPGGDALSLHIKGLFGL